MFGHDYSSVAVSIASTLSHLLAVRRGSSLKWKRWKNSCMDSLDKSVFVWICKPSNWTLKPARYLRHASRKLLCRRWFEVFLNLNLVRKHEVTSATFGTKRFQGFWRRPGIFAFFTWQFANGIKSQGWPSKVKKELLKTVSRTSISWTLDTWALLVAIQGWRLELALDIQLSFMRSWLVRSLTPILWRPSVELQCQSTLRSSTKVEIPSIGTVT